MSIAVSLELDSHDPETLSWPSYCVWTVHPSTDSGVMDLFLHQGRREATRSMTHLEDWAVPRQGNVSLSSQKTQSVPGHGDVFTLIHLEV